MNPIVERFLMYFLPARAPYALQNGECEPYPSSSLAQTANGEQHNARHVDTPNQGYITKWREYPLQPLSAVGRDPQVANRV